MKWWKFTFVFVIFINQFAFSQGDIFESSITPRVSGYGSQGTNTSDLGYSYEDGQGWLADPNGWVKVKIGQYYNNCFDYGLRIYFAKPTGGATAFKCNARIRIYVGPLLTWVKTIPKTSLRCGEQPAFYVDIPYTENWIPTNASSTRVAIVYDNSLFTGATDCDGNLCSTPFYAMPASTPFVGTFFISSLYFNRKTYTVSGKVTDDCNIPISGVSIGNTTTNALGEYSVSVIAGNDITLSPSKSGYSFSSVTYNCVRENKTRNFASSGSTNISLSSSSTTINCFGGSTSFSVTSNTSYTISSNQSWATPNITSGNGNNSVSVTVNQNNTGSTRTATITVQNAACNITRTYTITQEGTTTITVNTVPNADVSAQGGYSTTADFTGKAILYVPCGYSGTVTASKYCYILNSTFVSNPPTTINLSLTTSTVTISGTVTPTDASVSVVGYTVNQNTTTGAYSVNVPCDWSGSVSYDKNCFVTQTVSHTNVSANLTNQNITLVDDLPSVSLVSPSPFATVPSCTTTLSWTNAGAGVNYQVIAFGTTTNTQYIAAADAETTNTSITINHSSEPVKWFVRAKYPNCQWTPLVNRTFYPPSLNITYPTAGVNLEKGSNQTITWTSNGLLPSSNVKLELTDLAGNTVVTIANQTVNDGTYSWYTSFAVSNGNYRIKISTAQANLTNCAFDLSDAFAIISPNCPAVTNPPTGEALAALLYLMENGIINCDQDGVDNQAFLRRYDAAKVFFIGVFGDPYTITLADSLLTPFADINLIAESEIQALHRKFARVMTLFEGRNVRTAFDHDRWISFRAEDFIRKKDFVKALLEAFDIEIPTTVTGTPIFAEVPATDAQFRYVQKAVEIGVLNGTETGFNTNITREQAFVWLYRLHQQQNLRPAASVLEDKKSFFEFNNYTAENMGEITDASEATMGFAQTVFSISNRGFAATWSFAYSAQRIELPIEFYPHEYMGRGFSYTGNSYVLDLNDLPTNSQRIPTRNRVIVVLESGAIIWFKREGGILKLESEGVYDVVLTENTATNTFTFHTKDYITYTFQRMGDSKQPFVLTKAQDRYDNFYSIDYEPAQAPAVLPYAGFAAYRPTIVRYHNGSTPRFFYYNYVPNKNLIRSVHEAGGLQRKAIFDYRADNDALISYIDPMEHQYLFYYLDQPKAGFTVANTVKHKEYLLSQVRLPNGNVMDNQYAQKRMLSQKTYDDNGVLVAGQAATYYDPKPSEYKTTITIDNPEGGVMTSPTATPQANDRKYTVEYFPSKNRLRKKVTGPNTDTEYWYDHTAHPTLPSKIRNWNVTTEFWYDAKGNLIEKKVSGITESYIEKWTYNNYNDVLTYRDPDGKTTTNVYTSNGALVRVVPDGGTQYSTLIGRNSWGGVDFIENQYGIRTTFVTDQRSGNVVEVQSPLDILYNVYDAAERLRSSYVIDGETQVMKGKKYVYDLLDRLKIESIIGSQLGSSDSIQLKYERDANGNLLKIINDLEQETVFAYNEHTDYLMSESYAGVTRSRTYYGDGRIESITKTDGTVLHFEFDDTGRIKYVRQGIGGTILFTYQYKLYNPNLLDRVISQDGDYTLYHYNSINRIKEVVTHDGSINQNSSIKYEYLASGKLQKMTYPNGLDVTYTYGVNSWLSTVTAWNGAKVTYTYARDGKPTQMLYSNGVSTKYRYDDLRRPEAIITKTNAQQTIAAYVFKYDDFGNVIKENSIEQYNYTDLSAKAGLTEYGYGDYNILSSITSPQYGNEQVIQDQNGRRTQKGLNTYSWNVLDQMNGTTNGNTGFSATIGYDALGNINSIAKTGGNGNALRRFVWDALGGNPIMETKNTGEAINYYIYGAGMAFKINATTLKVGFYHHDLRGSTIAITGNTGEVTHRYGYGSDMFGELTDIYEPANDAQFFRYNGAYGIMQVAEGWNHNTKTGQLLSMRARWMDTESGRFLSEDPIWHSNLFPYADNNPVSNIDPSGKDALPFMYNFTPYKLYDPAHSIMGHLMPYTVQPQNYAGMTISKGGNVAHIYNLEGVSATSTYNQSKANVGKPMLNKTAQVLTSPDGKVYHAQLTNKPIPASPASSTMVNTSQSIATTIGTNTIRTTPSISNVTRSTSASLAQTFNSSKTFISSNRGLVASLATADGPFLVLDALSFGLMAGDLIGTYFDEEITTAGGWVFYQGYYRWK